MPALLGIPKGSGSFLEKSWVVVADLGQLSPVTAVVGLLSLAAVLAIRRWLRIVPESLVVVLISIVTVKVLHLDRAAGLPDVPPARRRPGARRVTRAGQTAMARRRTAPRDGPLNDVVVLRVQAGLFFAYADHTRDAVRASVAPATRAVVLDCETAPVIDVSAAEMLSQLAEDLARQHVQLLLAKSVGQVRDLLASSGVLTELHPTIDAAVAAARSTGPSPGDDADGTAPG